MVLGELILKVGVRVTSRLNYTCYKFFPFFKEKTILYDMHPVKNGSKNDGFFPAAASIKYNIGGLW
jgi:hypothetical protein